MYVFISILILISSVLLVLVVLVQNSKGGGLASGFSSSNQVLGVRKTTDFLEKFTWGLAGTVVFFCIIITAYIPREAASSAESEIMDKIGAPMNTIVPGFGTAAQPEAQPVTIPAQESAEPIQIDVPAE